MTTPNKLNEFHHAEDPARQLLERLGWTYAPREALAAERGGEREVLLDGILRSALLRLNEWLTEQQADRVSRELPARAWQAGAGGRGGCVVASIGCSLFLVGFLS